MRCMKVILGWPRQPCRRRHALLHLRGLAFGVLLGVLMLTSALSLPALAGGPVVQPAASRRFDHDAHNVGVSKNGKPAMKCESCHRQDATGEPQLVGKREHARCLEGCHTFTADCSTMAAGVGKVCAVCHPTLKPACLPPNLPQAGLSFEARFTHARHTAAGSSAEPLCARCHQVQAFAVGAPVVTTTAHRACSGCHERGAQPFMTQCSQCHQVPQPSQPKAANPYGLEQFDHRLHMKASKAQGCLTCHQGLASASENALPRPHMNNCQTQCHNGKTAFAATGTQCTTCHKYSGAMTGTAPTIASDATPGFSHAVHQNRGVDMTACGSCHQVESNGQVAAPGMNKDHKPCADSGCHEREFYTRSTTICTVCHAASAVAIVPWKKPAMTKVRPLYNELPSPMNHAVHVAAAGANASNSACVSCHGDKFANSPAPQGHDACATCHIKPVTASAPMMSNCKACHQLSVAGSAAASGTPTTTAPDQQVSAWSVAGNFAHTSHSRDPQKAGVAPNCTECHAGVVRATTLRSITAPTMQSCDRCHNGRDAFKTTGFDCVRCHGKTSTTHTVPGPAAILPPGPRRFGDHG